MYTRQFGLQEKPFSNTPDQRFLYLGEHHRSALDHLQDGLKRKGGVVLLTGEAGVGKTILCRRFLEKISPDISVALILNSKLTAIEFLAAVCDELGISYNHRSKTNEEYLAALHEYLLKILPSGKRTAIIIDDAHKFGSEVFVQLQKLTNSKNTPQKLLHVFLIGRPELLGKLKKPELASLLDDVATRFRLPPLDKEEVARYLEHRLAVAGSRSKVFTREAVESLYKHSRGIPKRLNRLCDRSLEMAYSLVRDEVDHTIVEEAAKEIHGKPRRIEKRKFLSRGSFSLKILLLLFVCLAGSAIFVYLPFFQEQAGRLTSKFTELIPPPTKEKASVDEPEKSAAAATEPAWLDVADGEKNKIRALRELFHQWQIDYNTDLSNGDPAVLAEQHGLTYLNRRANWSGLLYFNRPAIMELQKKDGGKIHAVLAGLINKNVIITVDGKEYLLPENEVKKIWTSRFYMLLEK